MPLPERYFTALSPSLVSGHFTTALGATCASSSPSLTMPSKSVATTSRLTSPGTIEQISSTSGRNGRFSFAISEGLVVTPSTTPSATPSLISLTLAVSRKIFIAASLAIRSLPLDRHARPRAHFFEDAGITLDLAHHVHRAGGAALVPAARRRRAEEYAEGVAGRPVRESAQIDHLAGRLGRGGDADVEVDLAAPGRALRLDRQRVPDGLRRLRAVELRLGRHAPRRDPNRPVHNRQVRRGLLRVSSTHPLSAGRTGRRVRRGSRRPRGTRSLPHSPGLRLGA